MTKPYLEDLNIYTKAELMDLVANLYNENEQLQRKNNTAPTASETPLENSLHLPSPKDSASVNENESGSAQIFGADTAWDQTIPQTHQQKAMEDEALSHSYQLHTMQRELVDVRVKHQQMASSLFFCCFLGGCFPFLMESYQFSAFWNYIFILLAGLGCAIFLYIVVTLTRTLLSSADGIVLKLVYLILCLAVPLLQRLFVSIH